MRSLEVVIEMLGVSEFMKGVVMKKDQKALGSAPHVDWNWGHLCSSPELS